MDGTAYVSKIGKTAFFTINNGAHLSAISKNTSYSVGTIPEGYRPRSTLRVQPLLTNGWGNISTTYPLQLVLNSNGVVQILGAVDYPSTNGIYADVSYPIP